MKVQKTHYAEDQIWKENEPNISNAITDPIAKKILDGCFKKSPKLRMDILEILECLNNNDNLLITKIQQQVPILEIKN